jgi:hypothetical protein
MIFYLTSFKFSKEQDLLKIIQKFKRYFEESDLEILELNGTDKKDLEKIQSSVENFISTHPDEKITIISDGTASLGALKLYSNELDKIISEQNCSMREAIKKSPYETIHIIDSVHTTSTLQHCNLINDKGYPIIMYMSPTTTEENANMIRQFATMSGIVIKSIGESHNESNILKDSVFEKILENVFLPI